MRWNYLETFESCGWHPCTVCGRNFPDPDSRIGDIMYFPRLGPNCEKDAAWIKKLWAADPYSDFAVCEGCLMGHREAVCGLTADQWLENWIAEYERGRLVSIRHDSPDYEAETRCVHGLPTRAVRSTEVRS